MHVESSIDKLQSHSQKASPLKNVFLSHDTYEAHTTNPRYSNIHLQMILKLDKRILEYLRPQAFQARDNQLVCNVIGYFARLQNQDFSVLVKT